MELFSVLQPNMFSVLTSKNREIYVSSLFVLRKAFLQDFNIEKDKLIRQLTFHIEKQLMELDLESENIKENDKALIHKEPKSLATFIIKRLEETGWIECEYNRNTTFKENVMLPPYAVKLINSLYEISFEQDTPYTIHLYNVYSTLYSAHNERHDYRYIALSSSMRELVDLENALKVLSHDLRRRYRAISAMTNSNEILSEHFDDYQKRIVEQIFIPLKTKDSVSRFKGSIWNILIQWLRSNEIMQETARQAFYSGQYKNFEEAYIACRNHIEYIVEKLDESERLLEEIDAKNTVYVSSVTQKLKHIINSNKSTKKRLNAILTRFKTLDSNQKEMYLDKISQILGLSSQGYFDQQSLFIRSASQKMEYSEPSEIDIYDHSDDDNTNIVDDALNSPFTSKNILEYLELLMKDRNELPIEQWDLKDSKELIIAISSTIRGYDSNIFYKTELEPEKRIQNNDYEVPKTTFVRRRKL